MEKIEIKTIEEVINELKNAPSSSWIWKNGKCDQLADHALFVDTKVLLERLKEYEVELDDETITDIFENGEGDNTYNMGGCNLSNDINFNYLKGKGCICMVHIGGDIRGNYTSYFAIDDIDSVWNSEIDNDASKEVTTRNGNVWYIEARAFLDSVECYRVQEDGTLDWEDYETVYENDVRDIIKFLEDK